MLVIDHIHFHQTKKKKKKKQNKTNDAKRLLDMLFCIYIKFEIAIDSILTNIMNASYEKKNVRIVFQQKYYEPIWPSVTGATYLIVSIILPIAIYDTLIIYICVLRCAYALARSLALCR